MTKLLDLYAEFIINSMLKLTKGECLSINTEELDFDFARDVANKALKVTCTPVKIVQTVNGRPSEVIDFDPEITNSTEIVSYAMLRINHMAKEEILHGKVLDVKVEKDNLRAIQKLGHLAEPVILDRQIAIPWANVPFYEDSDPRWNDIENLLNQDTNSLIITSDYRKKYFNHSDIDTIHIFGEGCDLTFDKPQESVFKGGSSVLRNGKTFVSSLGFPHFSVNVDSNSVNGVIRCNTKIFGKVQDLEIKFENGVISSHSPSGELDELISFDSNVAKLGYICFGDKYMHLFLGGALTDCLKELPKDGESLPSWFNDSLYTVELKLDDKLNAEYFDCDGKKTEIIRKGLILE